MQYNQFSDDMKTGCALIDDQHRALLDVIQVFGNTCDSTGDWDRIYRAAHFASGCVDEHMRDEELLQIAHHYPDYEYHKRLHDAFRVVMIAMIRRLIEDGPSDALFEEANKAVHSGLLPHIRIEDRKVSQWIEHRTQPQSCQEVPR